MTTSTRYFRGTLLVATAASVLGLTGLAAHAQDDQAASNLPKGTDLVERTIKAMGGQEAFDKIESSHHQIQIDLGEMGSMEANLYWAKGGKLLMVQSTPMGEMEVGSDGKNTWMGGAMAGGYQLAPKEEAEQMRAQTDFTRLASSLQEQIKDGRSTVETVEETQFDGKNCFKVKVTDEAKESGFIFFDSETGLIAGMEVKETDPMMGEMTMSMKFRDYKETDGIKNFSRVIFDQMGMEIELRVAKIEYNNVDPAKFEPPAQVKQLIEERNRAGEGGGATGGDGGGNGNGNAGSTGNSGS